MSANGIPVVLTVHGTFAGVADERLPHWWQVDGPLAADLKARFPDGAIEVEPFLWKDDEGTGPNRESERQRAARLLFQRVQEFERAGRPYHLVGHSHGGSVIWHALKYSAACNRRLKRLKSWTSISTPFLELGPDGSVWRRIAAAFAVAAALYWMGIWDLVPKVISALRQSGPSGLTTSIPLIEDLPDIRTALGNVYFFALITTFGVIALLFALWLVLPFGDLFRYAIIGPKLCRSESKAAEWYEPLWLGLAHPQDEAIAGLKATLIRAPDLIIRRRRGLFGLVLNLFQPAAKAGDQFAWSTLIRNAQGCDVYGTIIRRVAAAPEPFKNDVTPLPSKVVAEIEAQADIAASRVLARFRDRLQTLSDQADIAALSGVLAGTYDDDSLIHTSMFDNESVRAAIVDWIASPGIVSSRAPVRNVVARFGKRAVALSVAKAIMAVGIVFVVTVIAHQGYQIYYAESRLAAAERIIARFEEPAFTTLSNGRAGIDALLRAFRLGVSFEKVFTVAGKLASRQESFRWLMKEMAFKNGADNLLVWVLSPVGREKLAGPGEFSDGLQIALAMLAFSERESMSAATARIRSQAANALLQSAITEVEAELKRAREPEYFRYVPIAVGLGESSRALSWAAEAFKNDPECGWDLMLNESAHAVTDMSGIKTLGLIIRECNPKSGAEDKRRMLRRIAVGGLRSCEFAKPLLDQASFNRMSVGDSLQPLPLFLECLALDGRRDDAAKLSARARASRGRGAQAETNDYWSLSQALRKVNLVSEADEWNKLVLAHLDVDQSETDIQIQFSNDVLKLDILRAVSSGRHAAFLKDIAVKGDEFKNSKKFADSVARLRQIYAENFEKSRNQPCTVSNDDMAAMGAILDVIKIYKDALSMVLSMLSIADGCKFSVSEALYKSMFEVLSASYEVEKRADALAQLAAFRPTLRLSMASADAVGLASQILVGYVAAVDRHRPSARNR